MKGDKMKKNKMDPIGNLIRYGSFSAKWTTFFAVVALFSICALGLTKVSFALEEWPQTLTNSEIDNSKQLSGQSGVPNGGIANKYIQKNGQRIPIYCLEEWKHYGKGSTFNKKDSNSFLDDGAIALLTKAYTEYPSPSERQQAIIQLALWAYLYEHNSAWKAAADATQSLPEPDDHSGMSVEQMNQLKANTALWNDISPWIEFAVNNSQGFADPKITFAKSSNDFTVSGSNNEYVISGEITVSSTPAETLESFTLGLDDNAAAGTKIIVIKGGQETEYSKEEIKNVEFQASDLSQGVKLKVKIPTSELNEKTKNFKLTATGNYHYFVGYEYYLDDSHQTIAVGDIDTRPASSYLDLSASYKVDVPSTAQDSSMALYIIGLVVLLCGTGIIYANVKPAKQK